MRPPTSWPSSRCSTATSRPAFPPTWPNEFTAGLSFLPIRQVVAKADFQLRDRRYGLDELGINFGIGWLF
jgi:hypothetical protein